MSFRVQNSLVKDNLPGKNPQFPPPFCLSGMQRENIFVLKSKMLVLTSEEMQVTDDWRFQ